MSFIYETTLNRQPSYVFTDEVYSSSSIATESDLFMH